MAAVAMAASDVSAQTIPPQFQALHDELYSSLDNFRRTLAQQWDGSRAPVAFSANLLSAHSARGEALLAPGMVEAVAMEIDNLKALGVGAITLGIDFPMLYRPFHRSEAEYQQYLAFYTQLAREIRARDLTLVVATQALFSKGGLRAWELGPYYAGLTLDEYRQGRMSVARTIATAMRPDYLSVIEEPDTEADQTGKAALGTMVGSRTLLDVILAGLDEAGVSGVAIGAGIGTWQNDYRSFVESFASTSVDYIDIHVYPIAGEYLPRALEIADLATAYGKQIGMSETWLYKVDKSDYSTLPLNTILARDSFTFWGPLDGFHLQTMVQLAHAKRFAFMSPFWSGYFRGYVDYTASTRNLGWDALGALAQEKWTANLQTGTYTVAGHAYRTALVVPADVKRPAAPGNVTAQLASANSVAVMWTRAADNVGTSVYAVYRGGVLMTHTANTLFIDSNLGQAKDFTYSVVAFDAAGNASVPAAATIRTPDMTAPSMPQNLRAVAVRTGSTLEVVLTWNPSSDNVGVTQYVVKRGSSPDELSIIAGPTSATYRMPNARPQTTLHFSVAAYDATWNLSPAAMVSITTPAIPDTTPPFVEVVYPEAGATIGRALQLYVLTYDVRGGTFDDPSGSAAARFFIDGVPIGPEQTVPYTKTSQYSVFKLETTAPALARGDHQLTAVARDQAGNVAMSAPLRIVFRP
jgi:hypothetical protein